MADLFAKTFESFIDFELLLEDSTLSKTGMPKGMIAAVHKKAEHWEKYPRMAHTYRGGAAVPMPFKYHVPAHDIEITEPDVLTGQMSNTNPYTGRTIKSPYTDFHWFIESLPMGENRVLITNPDLEFYMYIYHKSKSVGATGMQYAIIWWDKERKKAIDFGYSELTTRAVDLSQIRGVHDTKGGNRSDKIQEFVRSATREGGKGYAPSPSKPLYAYILKVDETGREEPRAIRKGRAGSQTVVDSMDFINVFAKKYGRLLEKADDSVLEKIGLNLGKSGGYRLKVEASPAVAQFASTLGFQVNTTNRELFIAFRDFRKDLIKSGGGAYQKTSGFELEEENDKYVHNYDWNSRYEIKTKKFSPDEERADPQTGFREAQPEKFRRELPIAGEYASIESIIKNHTMDGAFHRFFYYLLTKRITFPKVNVLALLGITPEEYDFKGFPDFETWTL